MANIRINDVPQRIQYVVSSPSQSVFPIPYPFLANTDIVVWQDELELVQGGGAGQYGLSGAGTASGGTMTLVTAAVTGTIITITGETPIDRTSIYSPTISNLTGDDLNSDLNRIIIMLQELWTVQNFMMLQYKPFLELSQDLDDTVDRWLPILPPLYGWRKNITNTAIEAYDTTTGGGGGGNGTTLVSTITQTAHGFSADDVVFYNGTLWQLALADVPFDAEAIGMVSSVVDANTFLLATSGLVVTTNLVLVPGDVYFLSDVTPGLLTVTEPTTPGHISKPLFVAVSVDSGYFINYRGKVIPNVTPVPFSWTDVTGDTVLSPNMGYISYGSNTFTLPVSAAEFDIIRVANASSSGGSITIVQGAGQTIYMGNSSTTIGVTGQLVSIEPGASLELICIVANLGFRVLSSLGNFTPT